MCGEKQAFRTVRRPRTYQELREAGREAWKRRQMLADDGGEHSFNEGGDRRE